MNFKILALAVLLFSVPAFSFGQKDQPSEDKKIQLLIQAIEELENAKFYRNGSTYDAAKAADHLRLKLRKAGNRIKTAEQFIDKLASESSFSGKAYYIIFEDGKRMPSREFLKKELKKIERQKN